MTLLSTLPLRGKLVAGLDTLSHKVVPDGTWLARLTCDAWDLYVGMDTEDFLYNDGRAPSRLAYMLAGVKR